MSYCDDCIHKEVCGEEGARDEALKFCDDKLKAIPIEDLIKTIDLGITATGNIDAYSAGMCNGLIWLKTCYTHEEPNYVEAKQKSIPIEVLENLKAEIEDYKPIDMRVGWKRIVIDLIDRKISEVSK